MRAPIRRIAYLALLPLAVVAAETERPSPDPRQSFTRWQIRGGDPGGTRYSTLAEINRENVDQLKPAWIYRSGGHRGGSTIECNPIIIDGIMYVTTPDLRAVALDAATGRVRWEFDPYDGQRRGGVNRGLMYWRDDHEERIYYGTGNYLHAINARNGDRVRSFGREGRIDLREGFDQDVYFLSVSSSSPGMIYQDLIIMGSSVGEGPSPAAPGHIRAFNVHTGKREWIFHTIPHPGEFGYETWPEEAWKTAGGANSWSGVTLDSERGIVYFGTGSPTYDSWGGNREGVNLFGNCTLALDAATGRRLWHFQLVHHDLWDYDVPCPPTLVQVKRDGKIIDAVAQTSKVGHLFVFDRVTGEPLHPVTEKPVPQSTIPGEKSWPTQPFPPESLRYAQQTFTEAEATDLNPRARAAVLERLREMETGDIFLPPSLKPSVVLPQFNGGSEWGGAAFDPESNILYVNASNEAEWTSMVEAKPQEEISMLELGRHLYRVICSNCHGVGNPRNPASPSLATLKSLPERMDRETMLALVKSGRGQMPAFPDFSQIEKKALVAFFYGDDANRRVRKEELDMSWASEIPYVSTGHHEFKDPDGYPVNKRPWGTLNAIDLNEGRIVWQVPLGTYPALEAKGIPATGTFNIGGPLVTAGGLVFIGAAMDERFHAFDKGTGELVWEYQMDAGGYATPATYEIDGQQYVVIAAGGGGKPGTRPGDAYYCFALPD